MADRQPLTARRVIEAAASVADRGGLTAVSLPARKPESLTGSLTLPRNDGGRSHEACE